MSTREIDVAILTALDSHLSWCRHRHRNVKDVERELDELIVYLRRDPVKAPETEAERTNRVMRAVLEEHLGKLRAEARREGWL